GHCWRDGHADWSGIWRHTSDRATRSVARHRRSSAHCLWRGGDVGFAGYARRACLRRARFFASRTEDFYKVRGAPVTAAGHTTLPDELDRGAVLFRAKGLCKNFGGVRAVRDISFDIVPGVVFAVIGPNGAGKSTLLNLISGIYQPDAGTMSLAGIDLVG